MVRRVSELMIGIDELHLLIFARLYKNRDRETGE